MALLLADKSYLKVDSSGNFIIYKNKTARTKEKKLDSQTVFNKYNELIDSYTITADLMYYNGALMERYLQLINESNSYGYAAKYGLTTEEFPIMAQYFPNVNDSLPTIIRTGKIGLSRKNMTIEEVYEFIKRCEIFGKIDEVKDA